MKCNCCQPPISAESIYQDALQVLPGGVSRNTIYRKPQPYYVDRAQGCYVTDIQGVSRIDFANNMCSLIHGHAHPAVVGAVTEQLQRGTAFTMGSEVEVRYAQHLCQRAPGFEKIRFMNSGTEAVMAMIKAARAYTGRPKIAKAEGAYHGSYDFAEVSQTASPANWGELDRPNKVPVAHGTPQGVLNDVVVFPYNDITRTLALLDEQADQIACVLIDPLPHRIGLFPVEDSFLTAIYQWTRKHGALLCFDEVITFRNAYGGAQSTCSVKPDLTAMGKIIGGGFPAGAMAGSNEVMQVLDPGADKIPFPYSGTFSANLITMTAGKTAMELFDRAAVERLNDLSEKARQQIREAARLADVPVSVTGSGSLLRMHLGKATPPRSYREALPDAKGSKLIKNMLDLAADQGIMMINTGTCALSTVMNQKEIDRLSEVMLNTFKSMQPQFESVG